MFTKLRSLPWSVYRCAFSPECLAVKSASSSPTVAPSASTASFLSVYGLSGVGIRIFVAMKLALFECGAVVLQPPHRHVCCGTCRDRNDHICKRRPRVVQIVLRRTRRMVGMRMIEAEELRPEVAGPLLRQTIIRRPNQEAPPRPLFGRVRQRDDRIRAAALADERAAALVGIGF